MREIKFRGMTEKGEWKQGLLTFMFGQYAIVNPEDENSVYVINKETAGQYTGLKDMSGVDIYEGDILEFEDTGEEGYEYLEGYDFINRATVCYENGRFELENFVGGDGYVLESMSNECHEEFMIILNNSKVIGNRYENPELLKEEPTC